MKKMLIPFLTLMMVLGMASVSMAANTLSADIMGSGTVDDGTNSDDLSQVSIGLNVPMDDFDFSAAISSGTYDSDYDTTSVNLKGGFALVRDRQFRLDVTAGYYDRDLDYDYSSYTLDTVSCHSIMVGLDAKMKLDPKAWIDFSYAVGINPQYESDYYDTTDMDSLSLLSCKFNLLLNRQVGVSLGYSNEILDYGSTKDTLSGVNLGAFVRF